MNEQDWINSLKNTAEQEVESLPFAKRRYEICKGCDNFNSVLKICTQCYCFLPIKVRTSWLKCPIDKWGREPNETKSD